MKKTVTIKSNRDFQRLYRRGKSAAAGTLVVYCQRNRLGESRIGITTGTKLGHAVVRNKARRRIREIYRLHKEELQAGWDIIVVARVRATSAGYKAMEKDFLYLMRKLKLRTKDAEAPQSKPAKRPAPKAPAPKTEAPKA